MKQVILPFCSYRLCIKSNERGDFFSLLGAEFNGNFNLYLGEVKVIIPLWVFVYVIMVCLHDGPLR